MAKIQIADVKFRKDLYPRFEPNQVYDVDTVTGRKKLLSHSLNLTIEAKEETNAEDIRQTSKKSTRESQESPCSCYKPATEAGDIQERDKNPNQEGDKGKQEIVKLLPIDGCRYCHHLETEDKWEDKYLCSLLDTLVSNFFTIPEWCPLEDA